MFKVVSKLAVGSAAILEEDGRKIVTGSVRAFGDGWIDTTDGTYHVQPSKPVKYYRELLAKVTVGLPCMVVDESGNQLITSRVWSINESVDGLCIETANTLYRPVPVFVREPVPVKDGFFRRLFKKVGERV